MAFAQFGSPTLLFCYVDQNASQTEAPDTDTSAHGDPSIRPVYPLRNKSIGLCRQGRALTESTDDTAGVNCTSTSIVDRV